MGLFRTLGLVSAKPAVKLRRTRGVFEQMEPRQMLAGDGIAPPQVLLGSVYFENDTGQDQEGDVIQVSFVGGAAGTTLDRLVISGDKQGDGLSTGDVIFDTADGGLGDFGAVGLSVLSHDGFTITSMTVVDGGSQIIFTFDGFEAGEKFAFTLDADEAQYVDGDSIDVNSIVEGGEFQRSIMTGEFTAPDYDKLTLTGQYWDAFDTRRDDAESATGGSLALPRDSYSTHDVYVNFVSAVDKTNRTAGAVAYAPQVPLATLSGYVYHDRSDDGSFDRDTEEPIPGVTVELLDAEGNPTGRTTTTDANGFYEFRELQPGKYGVREFQPADYFDGKDTPGTHGGVAASEAAGVVDRITGAMLGFGDNGLEYNFGELLAGSIAGRVGASNGPDCNFDNPDIPLEGVRIDLLDQNGAFIRSTTTDSQGRYKFEGLKPGSYQVKEHQPEGYYDGGERAGTAGGQVSNDLITAIAIGSAVNAVNYDFCEKVGADLSGYVYHDRSDDGVYDPSETPIAGVTLKLLRSDGTDTGQRAVTNSQGYYQFTNLDAGSYCVMEVHPDGWLDGKDTAGSHGGEADPAVGADMICEIALNFGDDAVNYNFGELLPGSIAGRVHVDLDGDCEYVPGEQLLSGVKIDLLDGDGNFIRSTTTNAQGEYIFTGLRPGKFQVREHQPEGYYDGGENVGTAGGTANNDWIVGINLGSDQDAVRYDFCEKLGANLSGYVYHDRSDDGVFDTTESPIPDVLLKLLRGDGTDTGLRATTNAQGYYEFTNLDAGKYTVMEVQPAAYYDGKDTPGTTGGAADTTVGGDMISQIMLAYGDNSLRNNFGELLAASIAGRVHASTGPDCDFDNPEILLAGVKIDLLDANGNFIRSTTTNELGQYSFTGLRPGTYQVFEHQPTDYYDGGERAGTAGGDVTNDRVTGITLGSEQAAVNYDFCEKVGADLSGYVYHDRSDDGVYDPTETPIAGVTLKLLRSDGTDTGQRAVTNSQGYYRFTNLDAGSYCVMEVHPDGWLDGKDTAGSHGGEADPAVGADMICEITLNFGDDAVNYNFGELLPGSIAGRAHADLDGDCEYDPGEQLLSGVKIDLLDGDGNFIRSTTTDIKGEYSFTDLRPGKYQVREHQPTGYYDGGEKAGTAGGTANNDWIVGINLGSDQDAVRYDFCELPPAMLSGYVFIDGAVIYSPDGSVPDDLASIRDGQRTGDDTPLAGVTVELRNGITGDPIFGEELLPGVYPDGPVRTTTDANGFYKFNGLYAAVYAVVEISPPELIDGIDTPGSLGGLAVNENPYGLGQSGVPGEGPAIGGDLRLMQLLYTQVGTDAIVRIQLKVGQSSVENNFSEVRVTKPLIPPPQPLPEPPRPVVFTPPNFVPQAPLIPLLVTPSTPRKIYDGVGVMGYTWHLSVVNGGAPRHTAEEVEAMARLASARFDAASWERVALDEAQWKLVEDDAELSQLREELFGDPNAIPIAGDWDGDGRVEIGVFIDGQWLLDLDGDGRWGRGDLWAKLGTRDDLPVTGDWDGDGKTDIGIFGPAWPLDPWAIEREPGLPDAENHPTRLAGKMKNVPPSIEDATSGGRIMRRTITGQYRADLIDHVFHYGAPGDAAVAGDWNGDGIRSVGVFRDGVWELDVNGDGRFDERDATVAFGATGDIPVVGDWDGDGIDDLGVFRGGHWLVDSNGDRVLDATDQAFDLGAPGDRPIAGDWDGDGADEPAVLGPATSDAEVRLTQRAG
ncbi:Serine-aspartate repeat-containing protein D precursor [Pirellulimonas nuda]|uniref:Serine-aspartate repeat-containing protein D n=1 Tax=Pirellulimonas nuda TaxID=2528009 RepID=A0A518DEH4_9BACT|nr:SdrD B-like domain-containing protein [Pirellulimonas nuda]QDU89881.1 Serine-aspartate repeat-containing protein D precursor [Pirellulimonas nuda]